MIVNIFVAAVYLQLALNVELSYCQTIEPKLAFRELGKFCGARLTEQLHDFCQFFYGPGDDTALDRRNPRVIADECCEAPCSILYIILNYCKKPKNDAIRNTFGEEELKIYEDTKRNSTNGILDMSTLSKTLQAVVPQRIESQQQNVRKKKHVRKHRKKKRSCKCNRNNEDLTQKRLIPIKQVPDFMVGFGDYHENEPIIIANSL